MGCIPSVFFTMEDHLDCGLSHRFDQPSDVLTAWCGSDLPEFFSQLWSYHRQGYALAGYVSYEAGLAFMGLPLPSEQYPAPLSEWLVTRHHQRKPIDHATTLSAHDVHIQARGWSWDDTAMCQRYQRDISHIHAAILRGETYQLNYTWALQGNIEGNQQVLFRFLCQQQPVAYAVHARFSDRDIISLSPELFFQVRNSHIICRPMKGTAPRGINAEEDKYWHDFLQNDVKNRAENAMIVDLMRHDLAKIARPGSVEVSRLCHTETYPHMHQMISEIQATLPTSLDLYHIFQALFPCGSITGAPKKRTMQWISQLEQRRRGLYTGALGYVLPNGDMRFSVAIRTLEIPHKGSAHFGIGGGIVWDSKPDDEYSESLLKARFLLQHMQTWRNTQDLC